MIRALLALTFVLAGCATAPKADPNAPPKIRVMTFNVENLFDIEDAQPKNDEAFLPADVKDNEIYQNKCRVQNIRYRDKGSKSSGSDSYQGFRIDECLGKNYDKRIVARKYRRMTEVVKQINDGKGPDILFLQEVETEGAVRQWRDEYLKDMGYQTLFFIEGPDERGIDVAVLSKLPKIDEPKYYNIEFNRVPEIPAWDIRPTRGILEGHLRLPNGDALTVFALHLPSQGASSNHRKAGLLTLLDMVSKVPPNSYVIAGGDFNITSTEDWNHKYYRDLVSPKLDVSHLIGCKTCPGSTYYNGDQTWSFFDVLLFSKSLSQPNSAWHLNPESIRLANDSVYQTDYDGKPAKFRNGKGSVGVSDHWPMYAEIQLSPAQTVGVTK
jgi:endonuclease/exonuclease/phosphatase family metal-dependent hydrolase